MDSEITKFTKNEFKQIKYILYFGVFIVVFQAFQYIITKQTTQKYRDLFSETTQLAILANSVSTQNSTIHRSLLNITFSSDSAELKIFHRKLNNAEEKISNELSLIEKKISKYNVYSFEKTKLFVDLKFTEQKYNIKYKIYLGSLKTTSREDALLYRKNVLRPLLESFQIKQYLFLIRMFTDQQLLTEKISKDAGQISFLLLVSGNFLLVIVILFLIYIVFTERKKLA
jgi:hypothetical protein